MREQGADYRFAVGIILLLLWSQVVILGVIYDHITQSTLTSTQERNEWGQLPMTKERSCIATIRQWLKECEQG